MQDSQFNRVMKIQARKRFGQNYLTDAAALDAIIRAIAPQSEQRLLEIGAGTGALTLRLAPNCAQICALEIDNDLVNWWHSQRPPANMEIVHADALSFDFVSYLTNTKHKHGQPARLCGNLPYNVASPIIERLLPLGALWQDAHFLLQKEFAERLCASVNSPAYSRLSLLRAFYAEAELLLELPPEAFRPAPKVDSALVRLRPIGQYRQSYDHLLPTIRSISSVAFSARRKRAAKSLAAWLSECQWQQLGLDKNARPQQLSLLDFVRMAQLIEGNHDGKS